MLDAVPEPRIVITPDYIIRHANPAYRATYGEAAVGEACYAVSHGYTHPCDEAGESCPLKATLASGQPERVLHIHRTPLGEEHVDVELSPLADISGYPLLFVERMKPLPQASTQAAPDRLVGRSVPFRRMLLMAQRAAPSQTTVLLQGESGTGKEGLARVIHEAGGTPSRPFVPVDCASLSETLLESELFGYEKGAFTGATQRKLGLVEAASGGTLFLDEIGDLPLSQQVKLLRLLETGTFRRVGGVDSIPVRFRLVAATHRDLAAMVEAGSFRADLFYRLAVFPIRLPPLRERPEDIPLLAEALLRRVAPGRPLSLSAEALAWLRAQRFPGNVRELRNLLERASLLCDGLVLGPEHLQPDVPLAEAPPGEDRPLGGEKDVHAPARPTGSEAGLFSSPLVSLDALEVAYLKWACERLPQDRAALAAALGLTERTLYRRLARLAR